MEQDSKDILVAQLKADNFDLRQKQRDYNILNSQLVDLENRFKLLQDEKFRAERDAKERAALVWKNTDNLQAELRMVNSTIATKELDIKDIENEIHAYKELLEEKNSEITNIRKELIAHEQENSLLLKENKQVSEDLLVSREGKLTAQDEADQQSLLNNQLSRSHDETKKLVMDKELEAAKLRRQLADVELQIKAVKSAKIEKESELDVVQSNTRATRGESSKFLELNNELQSEIRDLSNNAKSLELQLSRASQKYDDSLLIVDNKSKELQRLKSGLSYSEDQGVSAELELRKLSNENDSLQRLLEKYGKDVDFQKRLKEAESSQKLQLELEKRKLANETLGKEIEARNAKRELEKVKDSHEQLLDDKISMNQELDAVKQHADLLEYQNRKVRLFCKYS